MTGRRPMRWLFYADTPLQIYLSSRIALTELSDADKAEIMVCDQFPNAQRIADQLVREGVFTEAHHCKPIGSRLKSFKTQLGDFLGMCSFEPAHIIQEHFDRLALSIYLDKTMDLIVGLRRTNPELEVVLYEDGTGSYDGQAFLSSCYLGEMPIGLEQTSSRARMNRTLSKLSPRKLNAPTPIAFFLRDPSAFPFKAPFPIKRIEHDKEAARKIEKGFDDGKMPQLEEGVVFLDSPRTEAEHIKNFDAFDTLIALCHERGRTCMLREHPRTAKPSPSASLCKDCSGGVWEVVCNQEALRDSILVAPGSTAQLTPYLESGAKPALLFIHRMMIDANDPYLLIHDSIVDTARTLYASDAGELICNASSLEEALRFIEDRLHSTSADFTA